MKEEGLDTMTIGFLAAILAMVVIASFFVGYGAGKVEKDDEAIRAGCLVKQGDQWLWKTK